jgi:hypothetical protein
MRLRSRLRPESEAESRWYALLPVASAALIAVAAASMIELNPVRGQIADLASRLQSLRGYL